MQAALASEALGESSLPCLQLLEAAHAPRPGAPSSTFEPSGAASLPAFLLPSCSMLKDPCEDTGPPRQSPFCKVNCQPPSFHLQPHLPCHIPCHMYGLRNLGHTHPGAVFRPSLGTVAVTGRELCDLTFYSAGPCYFTCRPASLSRDRATWAEEEAGAGGSG